ncbi:putative BOI-related E3 ubiquitin-protein ligase 3 [Tasmannia lanceolata]|uniref:putative BOI-related E3 ubiquitin-protein ligase 3 n=1 Tax=Tasmannia lanceolata TaxID=3420 RepID=UPI00406416F7
MAVEAHHLHLFPTQLINNREIINAVENNSNLYNTQMGFGFGIPIPDNLIPFYNSPIADSFPALTINNPFSFLGEDLSLQIQRQQLEIDRLIAHHTEKVRLELGEKRRRHSRRIFEVVEQGMIKRLKAKEEEIEKIGKLNWVLEEKVKSLYMENQIWRELARNNEATANALRSNIEQVLAHVSEEHVQGLSCAGGEGYVAEDAESCCDSNEEEKGKEGRMLDEVVKDKGEYNNRCRNCGEGESCVLFLPCRHLCLCTGCGSTLHICPICRSNKNASVHINMS